MLQELHTDPFTFVDNVAVYTPLAKLSVGDVTPVILIGDPPYKLTMFQSYVIVELGVPLLIFDKFISVVTQEELSCVEVKKGEHTAGLEFTPVTAAVKVGQEPTESAYIAVIV